MCGSNRCPARVAGVSTLSRWPSTFSRHTSSGVRNGLRPNTALTSDPPMDLVLSMVSVDMPPRPPLRDVVDLPFAQWEPARLRDGVRRSPLRMKASDLAHDLRRHLARRMPLAAHASRTALRDAVRDVGALRVEPQVRWIAARRVVARVHDHQVGWRTLPVVQLERETVRAHRAPVERHQSIPARSEATTEPSPARIGASRSVDLLPEGGHHVACPG